MREIDIRIWCDRHVSRDGTKLAGETQRVGLDGRSYTVDLCPGCVEELLVPLRELVEEYGAADAGETKKMPTPQTGGTRKGRPPKGGRHWKCLWCPATYAAETGISRHAQAVHGVGQGRLADVYGNVCPACGVEVHQLTRHAKVDHGVVTSSDLFEEVRDTDPHGVVAARLALAEVSPTLIA